MRSEGLRIRGEVEVERERVQGKEEDKDLDEPQVPSVHHGSLSLSRLSVKLSALAFFFSLVIELRRRGIVFYVFRTTLESDQL